VKSLSFSIRRPRGWREAAVALAAAAGITLSALAAVQHTVTTNRVVDSASTSTGSGQAIADLAAGYLGAHMGTKNDPNGDPPSWYEWWCADFAKYIWGKAGAQTNGLSAAAASFEYSYSHESFSATPHIGDVMVVGASPSNQTWDNVTHVAIVTGISGGQVATIGGDEGPGMWYDNTVAQQTTGAAVGSPFGTGTLGGQSVSVYVYGYASPYFPAAAQPAQQPAQPVGALSLRVADGSLAGQYASVQQGGGDVVQAGSADAAQSAQRFTFTPVPGQSDAYYIQSQATGEYLSARFDLSGDQRGTLYANVATPGQWETFHEQHVGANQALYVDDGTGTKWYVSTEMNNGGVLRARTSADEFQRNVNSGSWELFYIGS